MTATDFNQRTLWDESKQMKTASNEEKPQGLRKQEQTCINRQPSAIHWGGGEERWIISDQESARNLLQGGAWKEDG